MCKVRVCFILCTDRCAVATHLSAAGYYTTLIGKWHIGHNPHQNCLPNHKGFTSFYGLPYSQ